MYLCPLALESSSHVPPIPTSLGYYRAPVWVPWVIQQIPTGCLFTNVGGIDIYTLSCVKQIGIERLLHNTGAQLGTLWWPRGVGWGSGGRLKRERGYMYNCICIIYIYNYGWFTLFCGRNQHNIVLISLHWKSKF